jgi:hypothetical protein
MSLFVTRGQLDEIKTNNVVGMSRCSSVHHDMTNASRRKCTLVSHQYRVSLGQLKVNLGQKDSWAAQGMFMGN